MRKRIAFAGVLFLATAVFTMIGGCPQEGNPNGNNLSATELTAGESDALVAGAQGCQSLGQATTVAKSSAQDQNEEEAFDIPEIPLGDTQYTFGNCPEVTMSLSNNGVLNFNMDLDFGGGCTPYYAEFYTNDDYYCSGSASGSFNQAAKTITMNFETVSCGYATLNGDINVGYDIDGQTITLDGDWDLDYVDDIGPIQTEGEGTGSYDSADYVTTFTIFNGTITDTVTEWTLGLNGVQMSFPTYESLIPYAGEATISGSDIRTLKVKFDENSPTTGIVQVSIAGGPYFDVDLYALSGE